MSPRDRAIVNGYRSGLEDDVAEQLHALGVPVTYESPDSKLKYEVHTQNTYTPDFVLPNGIIVETKGRFTSSDRKKHELVRQYNPDKDIRFVFSRSTARISKTSNTTYAMWCTKRGFKFADKRIPLDWIQEPSKH